MGQRSQIYVRITQRDKDDEIRQDLVPMYYGWNYGERMVSRVASTVEWLENSARYYFSGNHREKLEKILSVNFDMKDVVDARNIFLDTADLYADKKAYPKGAALNDEIFWGQDNNDGKAFIDVYVDDKKDEVTIRTCFTDSELRKPLSAMEYLDWNLGEDDKTWFVVNREKPLEEFDWETVDYTLKNTFFIKQHSELMSERKLQEFLDCNYDKAFNEKLVQNLALGSTNYKMATCLRQIYGHLLEENVKPSEADVYLLASKCLKHYEKMPPTTNLWDFAKEFAQSDDEIISLKKLDDQTELGEEEQDYDERT